MYIVCGFPSKPCLITPRNGCHCDSSTFQQEPRKAAECRAITPSAAKTRKTTHTMKRMDKQRRRNPQSALCGSKYLRKCFGFQQ